MNHSNIQVASAIESIEACIRSANSYHLNNYMNARNGEEEMQDVARYHVERAFIELLILVDHLGLNATYQQINLLFQEARKEGLLKENMGPDEPYLVWCEKMRMYVDGISVLHGLGDSAVSEINNLKSIIKRALYVICDTSLFPKYPEKESDVHDRIEAILKCYFQDVRRKPPLPKPIKNFEADTGIPSSRTLIEYKFVTTKTEAKRVVDEILADASGYQSPYWKSFLFVIYETHRVMPEEEWTLLLKECTLGRNYDAMVLSGDAQLVG